MILGVQIPKRGVNLFVTQKAKNLKKTDASFWGLGVFFGGGVVIAYFEILIKQERTKSRIKESQSPPKGEAKRNKNYLLENCGLLLAFLLPYFLRSTTLESLVSKPLGFKMALKAIS